MGNRFQHDWGIEYDERGISSAKDMYVVKGGAGVKTTLLAPAIMCCMPSRGSVPVEVVMAWRRIAQPINTVVGFMYTRGMLSTVAREKMTVAALKAGVKYIYYADDDVLPPINILYKMMVEMEKDPTIGLLTAVYTTKVDPPHPHIYKRPGEAHYWGFSLDPYDSPEDIWGCGAGAMMVRTEAIVKMQTPYWAERTEGTAITGHDLHFCEKIATAGYRVCVDGSLICAHIHNEAASIYGLPHNCPPMKRHRLNVNTEPYWNQIWGVETWGRPREYGEMYTKICDMVKEGSKVVDLGAGIGVLVQWLINKKRIKETAYELSDIGIDFMKGRGINAEELKLESLEATHLDGQDYIICTEVLEHLEEDVMERCLRLMSESDAECIISVPTAKVVSAEHLRDFSVETLTELLKKYFEEFNIDEIGERLLATCRGESSEKVVDSSDSGDLRVVASGGTEQ